MPVFHVTAPDGRTIEVTAPEGATEADAIAYAQAHLQQQPPAATPPAAAPQQSTWEKAKAAAGAIMPTGELATGMLSHAVAPVAAGLAGLAGIAGRGLAAAEDPAHAADTGGVNPADVVEKTQNALTYQPAGEVSKGVEGATGAVAGVVPQVAGAAGNATLKATGSPLAATTVDTGIQALPMLLAKYAPGAARAARNAPIIKPAINFASDMLPGGYNRAAERLLRQYAGTPEDAQRAAASIDLHQAGESGALAGEHGMQPTTAGVAQSPGLAQMERTLRNQGGESAALLAARDTENRANINRLLTGISGTPLQRLRATAARSTYADSVYDDALNNPEHYVQPPKPADASFGEAMDTAQGGVRTPGDNAPAKSMAGDTVTGLSDIGTRLQTLLERPAMQDAMANASRIAANFGKPLNERNLIQQMHYAKMHLDDQIGAAQAAGKSNDMRALLDTKNELLGVMDDLSPAYAQARASFQVASRPINRIDIGQALRDKYMSALQEKSQTGSTPASFMTALRKDEGDALARTATGFGGASMDAILHPEDMRALEAIKGQLGSEHYAQNAGRSVGSPTAQNLANEQSLRDVGSLRGISNDMGPAGNIAIALHHPAIAIAEAIHGTSVRGRAAQALTRMALHPEVAADVLRKYQAPPASAFVTVPGTAAAQEQGQDDTSDGYAEGGQADYHKSSTWDLLKQGWKELTSSDESSAQSPQQSPQSGTQASGTVGADFDRRVQQSVDSQS